MLFRTVLAVVGKKERIAFVEAADRNDALNRLPALIALVLQVPIDNVGAWNLVSEDELVNDPFAESVQPDQALFVTGWSEGRPVFIDQSYGHPLFLLDQDNDRVVNAYLKMLRTEGGVAYGSE